MGFHPIIMEALALAVAPADLDPANDGPRPLSAILPTVVGDILAKLTSLEPRYAVRGGHIITTSTGRVQSVADARRSLGLYLDDALTTRHPDLEDIDVIHIVHLIHAIREAEGTNNPPPASMAKAA